MNRTHRTMHLRAGALAGALLFSVGVATALVLARPLVQPEWAKQNAPSETSVKVSAEEFLDDRNVPVLPRKAEAWEANSPVDGVIRETSCVAGSPMLSGQAPFLINDQKVLVLSLSSPPWRDFTPGLRGDDVASLQAELQRLGLASEPPTGVYDWETSNAVSALWEAVGADPRTEGIPLNQLIWIPAHSIDPSACKAQLGDTAERSKPLFTTGGGITALTVQLPKDVVPGRRAAVVGETSTGLPEDATIIDPEFLAAFMSTPKFQSYEKDPGTSLTVNIRLNEPVEVTPVPASALFSVDQQEACVSDGKTSTRVSIVASQFGNTMVIPQKPLTSVLANPGGKLPTCA